MGEAKSWCLREIPKLFAGQIVMKTLLPLAGGAGRLVGKGFRIGAEAIIAFGAALAVKDQDHQPADDRDQQQQ